MSVVHKLHVDNDMTWNLEDAETSFEFVEKLGEGYAFFKLLLSLLD